MWLICQMEGDDLFTSFLAPEDIPARQWTGQPEPETWRLFTPIPEVVETQNMPETPDPIQTVDPEVAQLTAMDIQRFTELVVQHPLEQRTMKAMQNLIKIEEVEFQHLTSFGYGFNHAVGQSIDPGQMWKETMRSIYTRH